MPFGVGARFQKVHDLKAFVGLIRSAALGKFLFYSPRVLLNLLRIEQVHAIRARQAFGGRLRSYRNVDRIRSATVAAQMQIQFGEGVGNWRRTTESCQLRHDNAVLIFVHYGEPSLWGLLALSIPARESE